ncbi:MAG: hypothetical protein ABI986_01190, partial [Chloroflexota bacterium]
DDRFETRKVWYWRNGHVDMADENTHESKSTQLALYPIDSVEEINSDKQFFATEITKEDFENHWSVAIRNLN